MRSAEPTDQCLQFPSFEAQWHLPNDRSQFMFKHLARFCVLISIALIPFDPAFAWGDEGHEIVASIAYPLLTPAAKVTVDALLKADKDTLTAPDFASRATWADKYRDAGNRKLHYTQTQQWHFVDTELSAPDLDMACFGFQPRGAGVPASQGAPDDCAANKIIQFSAELSDTNAAPAERLLALKFLMHFVGDIHQPLHSSDDHDFGGNCEQVRLTAKGKKQPLHHYWDTPAVEAVIDADRSAHPGDALSDVADHLRQSIAAADLASWQSIDVKAWALESFQVSQKTAYKLPAHAACTAGETASQYPAFSLSSAYQKQAVETVRTQLQKAGVRLAAVINKALL
jgi:hypothetical protein